ncbi:hypothetical protein ONS95_009402 [Cadophora gregata]|uniref:uncharacterized protein n=1 Tax=Cadophora gregata TaxID=51156 RepID=UPI0026DB1460|nr:uncharacterized protein ONS95_009402 [Cadophora gregata]KAK0124447.1 hypothetical protein ONS95_009402 [Cadophora gregata]
MTEFEAEIPIHDVLIVGAGPCGLAVAARLRESTPSALFTESEHQKFHFMKAQQNLKTNHNHKCKNKPIRTSRRAHTSPDRLLPGHSIFNHDLDIAVLDANSDQWMSYWNEKFESLGITHLRSPMFFHPDPRDRDGMLEFAVREGRQGELKEISGVVGKELSKHQRKKKLRDGNKRPQETTYVDERDRHDYFRPSQALFKDYCNSIVKRYDLSNLVQKSAVSSITYSAPSSLFKIQTSTGIKKARVVVLAIGAAAKPSLPPDCPFCNISLNDKNVKHVFSKPPAPTKGLGIDINTNANINPAILPPSLLTKPHSTLAIIGGGLTSAQIAHLASMNNIPLTHLIVRGPLKTKHFDVDLCWVAKFKNHSMSAFWKADSDEERAEMMRDARGGGSVNPEYRGILKRLVGEGRLRVWEWTEVVGAKRVGGDGDGENWVLELSRTDGEKREEVVVDHVVYATGIVADINRVEAVRPMLDEFPIETVGGMPCLTKELMWNDEIPFFITGRLGGLRLGPAAPNLEGARLGAEFIAGKIASLISAFDRNVAHEVSEDMDMRRLGLGRQNQFDVLGLDGSDSDEELRAGAARAML